MKHELEQALASATAIRFLCTGNVVRSAFAELYARHLGCPLPVDSAATTFQNAAIFEETRTALLEHGVAPELIQAFRPRHLSRCGVSPGPELLLLGMSSEHLSHWRSRYPRHERAFLLAEVKGSPQSIADPVIEGADWAQTFARIAACVEQLVQRLRGPRG